MTLDEFVEKFNQTTNTHPFSFSRMDNAALGLSKEVGTIAGVIMDARYRDGTIDAELIVEKTGDILWYLQYLASTTGFTLEQAMDNQMQKQEQKYPGGFSVTTTGTLA